MPPKGFDPYRRRLHNASQTKTSGLKTSEYLETHNILTSETLEKEKYEKNQSGKAGKVGTEGGKGGKKGDQKGEDGMKNGKGGKEAGKRKGGSSKQGAGNNGITGKGGGGKKGGDVNDAITVCNCDTSNPQFQPPTEREFQTALGANLQGSRRLQAKKIDVVDVVELEELPCASEVSEFKTYVAVEFDGNAPSSVDDIIALEQSFAEAYNRISDLLCDPFFRRVRTATIEQGSLLQSSVQKYVFRYVISGTCRGCEFDSNLFLS